MELRPWTLPNLLTFARLVALPFLIIAIVEGEHVQAFAIFFAMAVSDFVDGYLARHFGMASPLGALLDPIADKLLLVSTFIVFALKSTPSNIHIPLWLVLMTVGRDVLIVAAALVMALGLGIKSFPPTFLGKANTFAEISTVVGDPDEQHRPDAGLGRGRLLPRDAAPDDRLRRPLRLPGLRGHRPSSGGPPARRAAGGGAPSPRPDPAVRPAPMLPVVAFRVSVRS